MLGARLKEITGTLHAIEGKTAEKLGISPHHLSAVVKEASGESAMGWIHKAAIQRAKLLLSQGMTALQVSEALEFSSAPYFNRYFKRLTGMTPGEYQKR